MTPEAALQAQIERYRQMSTWEKASIGLRLHELSCELARLGIRRQNPGATTEEVEKLLHERLELARDL